MPGQDRNKNKCIIRNVTDYTLNSVTLDAQGIVPGQGTIVTRINVFFVTLSWAR